VALSAAKSSSFLVLEVQVNGALTDRGFLRDFFEGGLVEPAAGKDAQRRVEDLVRALRRATLPPRLLHAG
jgi:hypothetical protein